MIGFEEMKSEDINQFNKKLDNLLYNINNVSCFDKQIKIYKLIYIYIIKNKHYFMRSSDNFKKIVKSKLKEYNDVIGKDKIYYYLVSLYSDNCTWYSFDNKNCFNNKTDTDNLSYCLVHKKEFDSIKHELNIQILHKLNIDCLSIVYSYI